MDLLRKFLIRLRKEYYGDPKHFYLIAGAVALGCTLVGLAVDALLPFGGLSNVLRSMLLIPTALSMFILGYGVSLNLHDSRVTSREEWVPYRARFSPRWRLQIAAIVSAILFVLAYSSSRGIGYTLTSSAIAAIAIALLAFVRTTREESKRSKLGIPDARDVTYDARKKVYERDLAAKKAEKAAKKAGKS